MTETDTRWVIRRRGTSQGRGQTFTLDQAQEWGRQTLKQKSKHLRSVGDAA